MIYLYSPLRNKPAIELASGNDDIILNHKHLDNKAQIWNREYPDLVLNLHADFM